MEREAKHLKGVLEKRRMEAQANGSLLDSEKTSARKVEAWQNKLRQEDAKRIGTQTRKQEFWDMAGQKKTRDHFEKMLAGKTVWLGREVQNLRQACLNFGAHAVTSELSAANVFLVDSLNPEKKAQWAATLQGGGHFQVSNHPADFSPLVSLMGSGPLSAACCCSAADPDGCVEQLRHGRAIDQQQAEELARRRWWIKVFGVDPCRPNLQRQTNHTTKDRASSDMSAPAASSAMAPPPSDSSDEERWGTWSPIRPAASTASSSTMSHVVPKTPPKVSAEPSTSPTDMPYIPEEPLGAVMQERVTELFGMQLAAQERRQALYISNASRYSPPSGGPRSPPAEDPGFKPQT
ncbi:PUB12 [Symbiodinium sp. KB8]|nr:PUB12 [Symbiodinium sp. KB8]